MRRRFGRMRRGSGAAAPAVDAERLRTQLGAAERFADHELEVQEAEAEEAALAALLRARDPQGRVLLVAVSPAEGADAALVAVSAIRRLEAAREELPARVLAVAPRFDGRARRRLGCFTGLPVELVGVELALGEAPAEVPPEPPAAPVVAPAEEVAGSLARPEDRALFERARRALEGLAAKHGGVVRASADRVELVLLASRAAALGADEAGAVLDLHTDRRETLRLSGTNLAEALDRLEGFIRKRLNDRKVREGEDGLRGSLVPRLAENLGLRDVRPWPLPGPEGAIVDLVAVGEQGAPVAGVIRGRLGLAELGAALDAVTSLPPVLPLLLQGASPPRRLELPRLVLAARELSAGVERVLPALAIPTRLFRVDPAGQLVAVGAAVESAAPRPTVTPPETSGEEEAGEETAAGSEGKESGPAGRGRRRRRRGRGARGAATEPPPEAAAEAEAGTEPAGPPRFEVLTAFDVQEESPEARSGRRRRRSRGRGRRDPASEAAGGSEEDDEAPEPAAAAAEAGEEEAELPLAEDDVAFEELAEEEEELSLADRLQRERELRRRARIAKLAPEPEPEEVEVAVRPRPRRRAALAVHADRDSLAAAVLLARDLRLIEGIWVYPQSELMTFFRGPAIDLREDAMICVLGFRPSPLHDTLQAASLYAGRIEWYDHHPWPPEDVDALERAIGAEALHLAPGTGSLLPAVAERATRRSRFSDKFLDLVTGRFTQHDFERWGRLWWQRLGELAASSGEVRARLEPLLAGRPSDLAREAASLPVPPPPPEAAYVAGRDFRVVHFGGYALVVVPVPPQLDVHLAARIARERYGADLSLAIEEEEERAVLADQEAAGGRGFDRAAMVAHLDAKHGYVTALDGADHVARFRIEGLREHPERLDEVLAEIALGRSILEG